MAFPSGFAFYVYPDFMDVFFTTGQVANELKVSSQTIRNLCSGGQIQAERSAGGHFRIPASELERLKALDSLPATARATISGSASRQAKSNSPQLLAAPSPRAIELAEQAYTSDRELVTDLNKLHRMKIQKETTELEDYFDDREQTRLEKEFAEDQRWRDQHEKQREQRLNEWRAQERERFTSKWIAYTLAQRSPGIPEFPLLVLDDVRSTLNKLDPATSEPVVQALVDAAIARSLQPLRAAQRWRETKHRALQRAFSSLPAAMQWDSACEVRVRLAARQPLDKAPENTTLDELTEMVERELRPLVEEHEHNERIRKAMTFVSLPAANTADREDAQEAIRSALFALPVGVGDRQIQQAKQNALEQIQQRIAARIQKEQDEYRRRSTLAAKERLVQLGLREIHWHAMRLLDQFDGYEGETAWQIEDRVKSKVEETLRNELNGDEDWETVTQQVHRIMERIEK
jgi:excisionase family DNA binding protein